MRSTRIFTRAVRAARRGIALLLATVMLAGLAGCGDDGSGKGFRFPLASEPRQLDPQVSTDPSSVALISVLFEGLTRLDANGDAVPGAADWTVSEDGLTYTFTLRESCWSTYAVRGKETGWEDPVLVTADDFVFGMQRAVSPDTRSTLAGQLYGITGARAVHEGKKPVSALGVRAADDRTVVITLEAPDKGFLARLATTPFMPCCREFFEQTAGRYGLEKNYLLSNGAFLLTAWNHGQSLLLNKNEYYHAADEVSPAAVRFVIGEEDPAALTDGTMDVMLLPEERLAELTDAGAKTVTLRDSVRSVWFNTADEVLGNADIRRALRDSLEWNTIAEYLRAAGEEPAAGYIADDAMVAGGTRYRTDENAITFAADPEAAQRELGAGLAAVYPEDRSPSMPRLTVLASEAEEDANLARYLIQSWQKNLKIYSTLVLLDADQLAARVAAGNYQAAILTTTATGLTAAESLNALTTGAAGNFSGYADAGYDKLCEKARRGGRAQAQAAEARLAQDCPLLPLSFPRRHYGIAPHTEGITVRPFGGGTYGCPFEFLQAKKWDD